jgi:hypothetical protein
MSLIQQENLTMSHVHGFGLGILKYIYIYIYIFFERFKLNFKIFHKKKIKKFKSLRKYKRFL